MVPIIHYGNISNLGLYTYIFRPEADSTKCALLLNPKRFHNMSMSVVLNLFHVKDPQNDLNLAADHHLKICCSRHPPEAKI